MALLASGDLAAHKSIVGRSSIKVGPKGSNAYDQIGTLVTVGAVDGTVDIAPNQEVVKLQSSAMQNPYSVLETAYDYQVTFSMQEFDIYNVALTLSYAQAAVTGSNTLALGTSNQSPLRSMQIKHHAAKNASTDSAADSTFDFYKVKLVSSGSISFDRTGAAMLPVTAHCLGNDSDAVGEYTSGLNHAARVYG